MKTFSRQSEKQKTRRLKNIISLFLVKYWKSFLYLVNSLKIFERQLFEVATNRTKLRDTYITAHSYLECHPFGLHE